MGVGRGEAQRSQAFGIVVTVVGVRLKSSPDLFKINFKAKPGDQSLPHCIPCSESSPHILRPRNKHQIILPRFLLD